MPDLSGQAQFRVAVVSHIVLAGALFLVSGVLVASGVFDVVANHWVRSTAGVLGGALLFAVAMTCQVWVCDLLVRRLSIPCSRCGGRARLRSMRPWSYECKTCGGRRA